MPYSSKKKKTTSWGRVASWYESAVEREGSYHKTLILPNLKRLLGVRKGECVIDLGCGTGMLSAEFARAGANVVGVDLSKEFILAAQERAKSEHLSVRYHVGSAERLGMIANASADIVLIVLAIQNMEGISRVFAEAARVLKKQGRLALVINHPAFRIPKESEWGWDVAKRVQYRRVDAYLSEKRIAIQMHPGARAKEITTSFHRPLQSYVAALREGELCIANIEEWISNKKSTSGPRASIENTARKEFPLFLYIEARKV